MVPKDLPVPHFAYFSFVLSTTNPVTHHTDTLLTHSLQTNIKSAHFLTSIHALIMIIFQSNVAGEVLKILCKDGGILEFPFQSRFEFLLYCILVEDFLGDIKLNNSCTEKANHSRNLLLQVSIISSTNQVGEVCDSPICHSSHILLLCR